MVQASVRPLFKRHSCGFGWHHPGDQALVPWMAPASYASYMFWRGGLPFVSTICC